MVRYKADWITWFLQVRWLERVISEAIASATTTNNLGGNAALEGAITTLVAVSAAVLLPRLLLSSVVLVAATLVSAINIDVFKVRALLVLLPLLGAMVELVRVTFLPANVLISILVAARAELYLVSRRLFSYQIVLVRKWNLRL